MASDKSTEIQKDVQRLIRMVDQNSKSIQRIEKVVLLNYLDSIVNNPRNEGYSKPAKEWARTCWMSLDEEEWSEVAEDIDGELTGHEFLTICRKIKLTNK